MRDMVNQDWKTTVRKITEVVGVSCSILHVLLTKELGMSKADAGWLPRLLTGKHRVCSSYTFLSRYDEEIDEYSDRIITTDKPWFYDFDSETKAQSSACKKKKTENITTLESSARNGFDAQFQIVKLSLRHIIHRSFISPLIY